jgi:transposase
MTENCRSRRFSEPCHGPNPSVNIIDVSRIRSASREPRCQLRYLAHLRSELNRGSWFQVTSQSLRQIARRAEARRAEAASCEQELAQLVDELAPSLTAEPGVGPICAAQIICAWSHRGWVRSDTAFAALAGAAPIPAPSGQVVRHRLNRAVEIVSSTALCTTSSRGEPTTTPKASTT